MLKFTIKLYDQNFLIKNTGVKLNDFAHPIMLNGWVKSAIDHVKKEKKTFISLYVFII